MENSDVCQHSWQRFRRPNKETGGFTVTDRCESCGTEASREVPPVDPVNKEVQTHDTVEAVKTAIAGLQAQAPVEPAPTQLPATAPEVRSQKIIVHDESEFAFYLDTARFEHMYRVANALSKSTIVPPHYRENPSNVLLALNMAVRLNIEPFMFMQKTTVINDKLGFEAQLIIAIVNSQKPFSSRIKFSYEGTPGTLDFKCTAWAIDKDGERVEYPLTVGQAKKIGKASKNDNWDNTPELMLAYRSATYLVRVNCPEILMGMATIDELIDVNGGTGVIEHNHITPANPAEKLNGALETTRTAIFAQGTA